MSSTRRIGDDLSEQELQRQIDRICVDFEEAWCAGERPRIEDCLSESGAEVEAALLRELLLIEMACKRARGVEVSAADYLARFPQHRAVVTEVFPLNAPLPRLAKLEGRLVGRYHIQRRLGDGGFGTVYLARDTELDRTVAVKAPRMHSTVSGFDVERFIDEARTAAKLRHPAIVSVHDVVRSEEGLSLIVMEHIDGATLRDRVDRGELSQTERLEILVEVAEAIDYAHKHGFVHRDLEPRNILVDADRRAYVTDFGLAIHESVQGFRAGESAGSLAYMSPEQVRGEAHWLDGRTDIWALGVMLYEVITARRPFNGETPEQLAEEILVREPKPPRQIDDRVSPELERICLKCLSKSIKDRYPTASDLAVELRHVSGRAAADSGGPVRRARRVPAFAGILALVLILSAMAGAAWLLTAGGPPVKATVDIGVWDPSDEQRRNISIFEADVLPLKSGDEVWLEIQLEEPRFVYLVWVDALGEVDELYPNREAAGETQIGHANIPLAGQRWVVDAGVSGTECVLLLASRRPLSPEVSVAGLIGPLETQTNELPKRPLVFINGRQSLRRYDPRGVQDRPVETDSAVHRNQTQIHERLAPHFELVHAVCFAVGS